MQIFFLLLAFVQTLLAGNFSVATYNLEFYVDQPTLSVKPKTEASRRVIRESIKAVNADVIALQEVGTTNALLELRASLKKEGLDYPHWDYVVGRDPSLHLAFLSKHPITARNHHRNESYLHQGRRWYVSRGFGQVEIKVEDDFRLTLITAHLKSQRIIAEADQAELRAEEAILLRERIDDILKKNPNAHLLVLGDLNDKYGSRPIRTILGRGKGALFDIRPEEYKSGLPGMAEKRRDIVWTHFYAKEESYSRIDYILASPAMKRYLDSDQSFVLARPDWGIGSDHRPVKATFVLP